MEVRDAGCADASLVSIETLFFVGKREGGQIGTPKVMVFLLVSLI